MRPAEYSAQQVIEAGQALQAAGRNITGFALRKVVGGGEPRRLKQVWDEHLASQSVVQAEPVAELPIEVAEELEEVTRNLIGRLNGLAVELNDKAVKAAERRVTEVVRTAGEQREQAERELVDASQAVEELESQLEQATHKADDLGRQLQASEKARQALEIELAQLRERSEAAARAAKKAADQASQREGELLAELEKARRSEQHARDREAQAVGALQAAEARHIEDAEVSQRLRAELRTQGDTLAGVQAEHAQLSHQLAEAGETLKAQKQLLTTQGEKLAKAKEAKGEAETRAQVAAARAEVLQATLDKLGTTQDPAGQ